MRRLTVLGVLGLALAGLAQPAHAASRFARYVVVLRSGSNASAVVATHTRAYGARVYRVYRSAIRGYAASFSAADLRKIRRDPAVVSVQPDRVFRVAAQSLPTGLRRINGTEPGTGAGVNVAVLDTGIDLTHPDLAANIAGGFNCTSRSGYGDEFGHGTHVAGTIAAVNDGAGVVGVASGARLWSVRVLDHRGYGTTSSLVCGLDFVDSRSPARGGSIKVANMSLAAPGADDGACGSRSGDAVHAAICRVVSHGVTVVVAAGNENRDLRNTIPASYDEVLTVTALADSDGRACGLGSATSFGADDTFASFSNYGTLASDLAHTIAAPGADITSTYRNGTYAVMSGTSMAAPHVAAAAARYLAAHPMASPATVRDHLRSSGEPIGVNVAGACAGGLGVSHADPLNRHPEPALRIVVGRTSPARWPSAVAPSSSGSPAR